MVKWTKAHTTKGTKAKPTAEQKQTALGNGVVDMLLERGAVGDGALFAGRVARDVRETMKKTHVAIEYAAFVS